MDLVVSGQVRALKRVRQAARGLLRACLSPGDRSHSPRAQGAAHARL